MAKDAPTPKRKEAEAKNKVNAITSPATKASKTRDRNELKAELLAARAAYMRGEESALPARDRGPIKRYVRNYVDSRRNVGEYFLPAIMIVLVLTLIPNRGVQLLAILFMYTVMLYSIVSGFFFSQKLKKVIAEKFPNESTKGLGMYGFLRSTQMRRMRAPAPQVKRGDSF